jgi:hypothetical protein
MGFVPAPTSDFLIIFESLFLALSFLVLDRGGATYVGIVSGLLITLAKPAFFPYDLVFAVLFGLMVDGLGTALHAKDGADVKTGRLVIVMTISTGVVGLLAYYFTAVATSLVPNDFFLDLTVLLFGVASGAAGGYVAVRIWNRNLKPLFKSEVQ